MTYVVPNMRLIPQDQNNACWYASTQMLVSWRRNRVQQTESDLLDPSEVPEAVNVYRANNGIPWAMIRRYARMIGLEPLPLMTPTPNLLEEWLRQYGPLWCDGNAIDTTGAPLPSGHVVVLSGIRKKQNSYEIRIHNPWPPNVGNISWVPISYLNGIFSDGDNPNRNAFLLRLPRVIFSRQEALPNNELICRLRRSIE